MTLTSREAQVGLLEVRLSDGTYWRGTPGQLRRSHPDWLPHARRVAAHTSRHADAAPYGGHSASLHPEDVPPYTTDEQAADEEEEDALAGYPDERPRVAPASAVRTMQRYQGYAATRVDIHPGPPPLVRRASRHQSNPKRPVPDDGVVYQMPPKGGWQKSETEAPAATTASTATRQRTHRPRRVHPLLFLGVGMLLMLILWQLGTSILSWWQVHQDDVTYGRPRTYQTDAVVGHFDSAVHPSHFLAENLHQRIVIFELPGGDASKARIYVGPLLSGTGADLAPVTLSFPVIGGKPAMVATVGESLRLVYLNKEIKGVWQFVQQQG